MFSFFLSAPPSPSPEPCRCTLIVLAEWKPVESVATYDNAKGVSLITAAQRRHPPSCLDSKIHHNNLLNNILPKIQANLAGCADAIMLVTV
jgi:branched-subunit amino acid aminotransferase/4-amino-4-deoxychorismate lyase